ncbi:MAG: hypothetical protein M0D55_20575 [Elusimicrobiota bacterium]|nr:MAG: hypothetical protein M0D55_20575 [Elusimicrobiota bacterium]
MDGLDAVLLLLALAFPAATMFAISRLSGWPRLASRYPDRGAARPRSLTLFGYGTMRGWVGYNGGLILGADDAGLHVATWPVLMSWCHAPVFIPWTQIADLRAKRRLWKTYYRLDLKSAPDVDFALSAADVGLLRPWLEKAGVPVLD